MSEIQTPEIRTCLKSEPKSLDFRHILRNEVSGNRTVWKPNSSLYLQYLVMVKVFSHCIILKLNSQMRLSLRDYNKLSNFYLVVFFESIYNF